MRESLVLDVARWVAPWDVLDRLYHLFLARGVPAHIRSDNGSEIVAKAVRDWLHRLGRKHSLLNLEVRGKRLHGIIQGEMPDSLLDART